MNEADALAYRYLFYYAAENSIYPDYVSEKFFRGLQVGTVPIYLGSPTGPNFAPAENAVLWLRGLEDVPRVAEEIKRLTNDRAAYEVRASLMESGSWLRNETDVEQGLTVYQTELVEYRICY